MLALVNGWEMWWRESWGTKLPKHHGRTGTVQTTTDRPDSSQQIKAEGKARCRRSARHKQTSGSKKPSPCAHFFHDRRTRPLSATQSTSSHPKHFYPWFRLIFSSGFAPWLCLLVTLTLDFWINNNYNTLALRFAVRSIFPPQGCKLPASHPQFCLAKKKEKD